MKKSFLYGILAVAAWSTMPVVGKSLLSQFNSLEVLGYGSLIGAVFLSLVLTVKNEWNDLRQYQLPDLILLGINGFIGYFLYSVCYNTGLALLPAHIAGTLNYIWPVFAILLSAVFLKEKITKKASFSILLSLLGVCVMMGPGESGGKFSLFGFFCCIFGALLYSVFNIANKRIGKNQLINMTVYLYIGAFFSFLFSLGNGFTLPTAPQFAGFLWIGIVIDALAYLFWAIAMQSGKTSVIVNLSYLTPVLAMLLSAVFFGEHISASAASGLVLILAGQIFQTASFPPKHMLHPGRNNCI